MKMQNQSLSASSLKKGDVVRVSFQSMAPGGEAVSKDLGIAIFADRAAPGDIAEVELVSVKKDYARGKVISIVEPSAQREEPSCKLFKVCGGCQWQHLAYEKQLEHKTSIVKQAVERIGGMAPSIVNEIVRDCLGAADPLHYRNKVQFPVRNPRDSDRILAGYYKPDSHDLVNIKHCPVQSDALDSMLSHTKEVLEKHKIRAYDEKKRRGLLRHINARESKDTGEILVTLVINADEVPAVLYQAAKEIMAGQKSIVGVMANLNRGAGNRILGDATVRLAGREYIVERLKSSDESMPERLRRGLRFQLSSTSFFQINSAQALSMLEIVRKEAYSRSEGKEPLVIDAYAGVGTIALFLSSGAERVIAIEEHPQAVDDGINNAELNEIANVEFRQGTVEDEFPALVEEGLRPDVVVLDPPRKGASAPVLEKVMALSPRTIVYVSCNPATLARDLKILENGSSYGYKTIQIQPVDLFPQTYHVESVATLERVSENGSV